MDVKIDVTGQMDGPKQDPKAPFDFSNISNISSRIPSLPEFFRQLRQNLRPLHEFLSTQNFKPVPSVQRLSSRLVRNLTHFQSNYLCVFLVLMAYCLVTSPLILVVLAGVFYACYKVHQAQTPVTIFGRRLNAFQQCLLVNFAAAPVLYLAGAGSVMFWVIGASFFVIGLHAIFYNIDAIVTEETDGFLAETV